MMILPVLILERQFAIRSTVQIGGAVAVLFLLSLASFCCLLGFRLLRDRRNRPDRKGALLSPPGWMALALCFWVIGLTVAAIGLGRSDHKLLLGALGYWVLGFGSALAAKAASRKRASSPVFSPETSLLQKREFVPAGFLCGIELKNDNLTPMEFVVSVLRNCVGLSETDAIRTMLEIHTKGGVLLPMQSFDDSRRVAELVSAEARSKNHPLACRAVSTSAQPGTAPF